MKQENPELINHWMKLQLPQFKINRDANNTLSIVLVSKKNKAKKDQLYAFNFFEISYAQETD